MHTGIIERIKAELERQERTQAWLSRKTGLSYHRVWRICGGHIPTVAEIVLIARALDVPVSLFMPTIEEIEDARE